MCEIVKSSTTTTMIAYKIQMTGITGWGDLKSSEDDGETYIVESFKTKKEAQQEINDIVESTGDDQSNYRIVNWLTPEDINFYN